MSQDSAPKNNTAATASATSGTAGATSAVKHQDVCEMIQLPGVLCTATNHQEAAAAVASSDALSLTEVSDELLAKGRNSLNKIKEIRSKIKNLHDRSAKTNPAAQKKKIQQQCVELWQEAKENISWMSEFIAKVSPVVLSRLYMEGDDPTAKTAIAQIEPALPFKFKELFRYAVEGVLAYQPLCATMLRLDPKLSAQQSKAALQELSEQVDKITLFFNRAMMEGALAIYEEPYTLKRHRVVLDKSEILGLGFNEQADKSQAYYGYNVSVLFSQIDAIVRSCSLKTAQALATSEKDYARQECYQYVRDELNKCSELLSQLAVMGTDALSACLLDLLSGEPERVTYGLRSAASLRPIISCCNTSLESIVSFYFKLEKIYPDADDDDASVIIDNTYKVGDLVSKFSLLTHYLYGQIKSSGNEDLAAISLGGELFQNKSAEGEEYSASLTGKAESNLVEFYAVNYEDNAALLQALLGEFDGSSLNDAHVISICRYLEQLRQNGITLCEQLGKMKQGTNNYERAFVDLRTCLINYRENFQRLVGFVRPELKKLDELVAQADAMDNTPEPAQIKQMNWLDLLAYSAQVLAQLYLQSSRLTKRRFISYRLSRQSTVLSTFVTKLNNSFEVLSLMGLIAGDTKLLPEAERQTMTVEELQKLGLVPVDFAELNHLSWCFTEVQDHIAGIHRYVREVLSQVLPLPIDEVREIFNKRDNNCFSFMTNAEEQLKLLNDYTKKIFGAILVPLFSQDEAKVTEALSYSTALRFAYTQYSISAKAQGELLDHIVNFYERVQMPTIEVTHAIERLSAAEQELTDLYKLVTRVVVTAPVNENADANAAANTEANA